MQYVLTKLTEKLRKRNKDTFLQFVKSKHAHILFNFKAHTNFSKITSIMFCHKNPFNTFSKIYRDMFQGIWELFKYRYRHYVVTKYQFNK